MHTERHREPALPHSRSDVLTWTTSGLSTLTQKANQDLGGPFSMEDENNRFSTSAAYLKSGSNTLPTEADFKRVIEKLTRLYAQGGVESLRTTLQEGKSHDFILEADEWIYARLNVQGEMCPAVITLTRSQGRVTSYISKTIQEPMDMVCDAKFTGDRIWVSDPGIRFRTSTLFIGFHALEESIFAVNVQFGQKKKAPKGKYRFNADALGKDDYWTKLFGSFIEPKPKFLKNFVEINRNQARDSPERGNLLTERSVVQDLRRKEAVKRWKVHLNMRRSRALELLNRQELKEIQKAEQMRLAKEKAAVSATQQKWVTMIWGLKCFEYFLAQFEAKKAELAVQLKKVIASVTIQQAYRRRLQRSDRRSVGLRRCCFNFRLAFRNLAQLEETEIRENLMKCMQNSAKNARLPIQFMTFYDKSK